MSSDIHSWTHLLTVETDKHPEEGISDKFHASREHLYVTGNGFGDSEDHPHRPYWYEGYRGGPTRERRDYVTHTGCIFDGRKKHPHGGDPYEKSYDSNPRTDGSAHLDCCFYIGSTEHKNASCLVWAAVVDAEKGPPISRNISDPINPTDVTCTAHIAC